MIFLKQKTRHKKIISGWRDGSPGFTTVALNAMEIKFQEMSTKGKQLVCSLIMDEMYIKQGVHYNCKCLQGCINYGIKSNNIDELQKAREALVGIDVGRWCP